MAEYITKDEALYAVEDAMELTSSEYDMIAEKIDNVPVADVEPVIHAHWITGKRLDTGNGFKPVLECSNCHALIPCDDFVTTNGCPCCRAKMDGGTDNEP